MQGDTRTSALAVAFGMLMLTGTAVADSKPPPPKLVATAPAAGSRTVPTDAVQLQFLFDQPLSSGGRVELRQKIRRNKRTYHLPAVVDGNTVTAPLTTSMLADGDYEARVSRVVATNGRKMRGTKKVRFHTAGSGSDPGAGDPPTGDYGDGVSLGGRVPFPSDNPWNQDISGSPVDPNSANLIASIGITRGLHPDFGTVWEGAPIGIPYTVVSGSRAKVPVQFEYADESDAGPYPIPANPPIEGGASSTGDRHILIIDRDNWILYELFSAYKLANGSWQAGSGAIFDLKTNALRPLYWTSADAAGLPIFPGLVRYDEVMQLGEIRHALRFTVQRTRHAFVSPARHFASSLTDPNLPPMGMRVRLKAGFDISGFPAPVQVILRAMKKYGMFVADNGSNWFVSGAPDSRWDDEMLSTLGGVHGGDFEVVEMGDITTD